MTNVLLGFSYGEQTGVCNIFVKNKYLVVSSDYLSKIQHKIPGQKKKKKKGRYPPAHFHSCCRLSYVSRRQKSQSMQDNLCYFLLLMWLKC